MSFLPPPCPDRVLPALAANSKRAILTWIARAAAQDLGRAPAGLLDALLASERENPSAIGGGIALPQTCLDYLERPYLLLARLAHKVDFQAPDRHRVDLVWVQISPASDRGGHLRALGSLARSARDEDLISRLRSATTEDAIRALFIPFEDRRISTRVA